MNQILIISGTLGLFAVIGGLLVFGLHKLLGHKGHTNSSNHVPMASLHDEKQKSDIILNAIEDGVILLDEQKTIQLFNPAAGTITGWNPPETIGLDYHGVLEFTDDKNEPCEESQNPITRVFAEQMTVREHNLNLYTRSNKNISVEVSVSPLFDEDSNLRGVVAIFRDVSEQRHEEQRRTDFVSTASHEMRTPVAAIEGYLALALNEKVSSIDSKARGYLEKAHDSATHLGQLFQDLLTSAKAEDGRLSNHPVVTEMGSYTEQLAEDLKFSAQKKGLGMEFVLGAPDANLVDASVNNVVKPLYYANIDPDRMREVITNLFDNAVKYTEKGKVTIGLTGDQNVVQIRITDTGPGIPADDIPHLFQKFYRVDNSATRTIGGTGLGLFICRKIVELYQGRIWVESTVNQGSTFYINLPRLSGEKAQALQNQQAMQPTRL